MTLALKFNPNLYHPNDRGNLLLKFRERGFAVLGNVFDSDTVAPYRQQLESLVTAGGPDNRSLSLDMNNPLALHVARAPRLLQALRGAFMPWIHEPQPTLLTPVWRVNVSNPNPRTVHDWHKDADHTGLGVKDGYTHPQVIHTAIYLEDMTPETGPTYVIPRSHRDHALSPYAGAQEEPFLPGAADVVIWDQRLWHRGSARTVPGMRMVALFTFIPCPIFAAPIQRSAAQIEAARNAATDEERILFGGPFADGEG